METMQKDEIIRAILSMPPQDRIEIIDKIYEDFETERSEDKSEDVSENYEALWAEEAVRRVEAYKKGEIEAIPLEYVLREISELK